MSKPNQTRCWLRMWSATVVRAETALERPARLGELHRQACVTVGFSTSDAYGSAQLVELAGVGCDGLPQLPHVLEQCWVSHVCLRWFGTQTD
jgi:hypothetical protein